MQKKLYFILIFIIFVINFFSSPTILFAQSLQSSTSQVSSSSSTQISSSANSSLGLFPNTITLNFSPQMQTNPEQFSVLIKIVLLLTILAIAPSILIMVTSFTRIVIVLSFIRRALSLNEVPPTSVLMALALFLTAFTMAPTWNSINKTALQPYLSKQISDKEALNSALVPIREFMFQQTRKKDLALFYSLSTLSRPMSKTDIPTYILIPAFMISELKTAFLIGFIIYLPFLVIDMVVSSILLSMGMMMLPPVIISLPFKIILFVLVDGWNLVIGSLLKTYL